MNRENGLYKSLVMGVLGTLALGAPVAFSQSVETAYVCENSTAQYDDPTQFVECNSKLVLGALNDESLTKEARTIKFDAYMNEFANIEAIGKFTLGSYARRIKNEPDLLASFLDAFRSNMLTVYQLQLDELRGDRIDVVRTIIRRKDKDAIIETIVTREGKPVAEAHWRIIKSSNPKNPRKGWQVADVGIDFDGQLLWLAIEQKEFHKSILNDNYGSFQALIDAINVHTAKLKEQLAANNSNKQSDG